MTQCFQPSARQMNWLIAIGFGSVFYAYYLRYRVIENTQVFMACQEGLDTWLCATLDLGILLFALALGAAGFGLVMQNGDMAGFAVGLLVLSLARPARSPG